MVDGGAERPEEEEDEEDGNGSMKVGCVRKDPVTLAASARIAKAVRIPIRMFVRDL